MSALLTYGEMTAIACLGGKKKDRQSAYLLWLFNLYFFVSNYNHVK